MPSRVFLLLIALATTVNAIPPGWSPPFFFLTNNNASQSSIAVDSTGGVHIAFSAYKATSPAPVYYAYCPSSCTSASRFTVASFGDVGDSGGHVSLALDGGGHPRVMYFNTTVLGIGSFVYAECNASCTNGANWTQVTLPVGMAPDSNHYFALDPQGRPRFLYTDSGNNHPGHNGLFYAFCDSACTSLSNWFEGQIDPSQSFQVWSLVFNSGGAPRAALTDYASTNVLGFAQCDANCADANNWSAGYPYSPGAAGIPPAVLRLDTNNRPRLAFYSSTDNKTYYAFCNAACTSVSNWTRIDPGFPTYTGQRQDMLLNAQNRPQLALRKGDLSEVLAYATCTANCESVTGTWQIQTLETGNDIDLTNPIAPPPPCTLSAWYAGDYPAIAVDGSGSAKIAYDAHHDHGGFGGGCTAAEDIRLTRYTQQSIGVRGDANGDGSLTVADIFYLINNLFAGGPPPGSTCSGDANGDGITNVADIFYVINNLFAGGPAPAGC